jgi:hypothetical protein
MRSFTIFEWNKVPVLVELKGQLFIYKKDIMHLVIEIRISPQIFLVVLARIDIYCHNSETFQHAYSRTIEVCEGLYTSNQADLCRLRVELGAEILTSCALCDSQSGSPLIPRQQTSHVQQDHPHLAASSIPSFCLSTDGCRSCSVAGSCPMDRLLTANRLQLFLLGAFLQSGVNE